MPHHLCHAPFRTSAVAVEPHDSQSEQEAEAFADSHHDRLPLSGALAQGLRLHTDDHAAAMNAALGADAFTHGRDIYFARGAYRPETAEGRHLIAHEYAHAVQQGGVSHHGAAGLTRHGQPRIARRLSVLRPRRTVPGSGGQHSAETNAQAFATVLNRLCPEGRFTVNPRNGRVSSSVPDFCTTRTRRGGIRSLGADYAAQHLFGCTRLCQLVNSRHHWRVQLTATDGPTTFYDSTRRAERGRGTGGRVLMPSPNHDSDFGAVSEQGDFVIEDTHILMGHELLGHGYHGDLGTAAPDHGDQRGRGGHQQTVAEQNRIGREQGRPMRGSHRDPYCGESFSVPHGVAPTPGNAQFRHLHRCEAWRNAYNQLNGTHFTISDRIPPNPNERLPPNTVVNGQLIP